MKSLGVSLSLILMASGSVAMADDVVLKDKAVRDSYLQRAEVWFKPAWISNDFKFSSSYDIQANPPLKGIHRNLADGELSCVRTEKDVDENTNGKSRKFSCRLTSDRHPENLVTDAQNKTVKYKVKYNSPEVFGEVLSTRLLHSLGFGADKMYFVETTKCYGCTDDPFKKREVNALTMNSPQVFESTAVELKYEGENIVFKNPSRRERQYRTGGPNGEVRTRPETAPPEGWTFKEILKNTSSDRELRRKQLTERDALRLITLFMQHGDNKAENARLVCLSGASETACDGRVAAILQDVGLTFGQGFELLSTFPFVGVSKLDLEDWEERPLFRNPAKCETSMGMLSGQFSLRNPQISEEGRQFLAKLMAGFVEGEAGRARVRAMFEHARVDRYNSTIDGWTNAFLAKVEQLRFPMGRNNPDFKCPLSVDDMK